MIASIALFVVALFVAMWLAGFAKAKMAGA